jgi:hypothetical protein
VNLKVFKAVVWFGATPFLWRLFACLIILYSLSLGHPDSQGLIQDYALPWGIEILFGIFFLAFLRLVAFAWNLLTLLIPNVFVSFWLYLHLAAEQKNDWRKGSRKWKKE